ncbi:hypothetical protein ACFQ51_16125 [Streptomyces kaempferi]
MRTPNEWRLPVHSFPGRFQAIETNPEQSCRYPSDQYALMLYGTCAVIHFLARLMIAARVVAGTSTPVPGFAGLPEPMQRSFAALRRVGLVTCGVARPGGSVRDGDGGTDGTATRAAPAAAAITKALCDTGRPSGPGSTEGAGKRRLRTHPGQSQSLAGSNSSNTGVSMRRPSHSR